MFLQFYYHFLLFLIVLLLLRFIWRSSYTLFWHFLLLAEQGVLAAVFLALLLSQFIVGRFEFNLAAHGLAWHGSFFLFASAFLMYRQKRSNGKPRRYIPSSLVIAGCLYFAASIDALLIEPAGLVIRELTIPTSKITKPMTIVFCTDMQTERVGDYERWTLQKIKEQHADLILFGGDYIQGDNDQENLQLLKDWNQLFREIDLQAPLGIYAVQGNKELSLPWKDMFEDTTVFPRGQTTTSQIGEIRITFLSLWSSRAKRTFPDKERGDQFRIIVGHTPIFSMAPQEADLLLAGHTHGGQAKIPYWGPIRTNAADLPRKWASGLTTLPSGAALIVSHGSGLAREDAPRVRFLCRPDFWVIRLVPGDGTK